MTTIAHDIIYRARVANDTTEGAAKVRAELAKIKADTLAMNASTRQQAARDARILRNSGESGDADRVERRAEFTSQLADLRQQTAERIAKDKENQETHQKAYAAERRRIGLKYRQAERSDVLKGIDEEAGVAFKAEADRKTKNASKLAAEIAEAKKKAGAKHGEGGGGGGHGFNRVLQDQSTTGLGPLGRAVTLATGGVMLAGVAVATKVIADVAAKAVDMADAYHRGQQNAASLTLEIAKEIPIVGNIAAAEESIYELYTHQKRILEERNAVVEEGVSHNQRMYELGVKIRESDMAHANELRAMAREGAGAALRGSESEQHGFASKRAGIQDQATAARQKVEDEIGNSADVQAIDAKIDEAVKKFGGHSKVVEQLEDERTAMLKQKRANRARELRHIDESEKAALYTNDVQGQEAFKKNAEKFYSDQVAHDSAMAASAEQTAAKREATAGNVVNAKKREIQAATDAEKAQASQANFQKYLATTDVGERAIIEKQGLAEQAAIEERGQAALAQADKDARTERRRALFDAGQAEKDAQASVTAQNLREAGRGYDAERQLREREHNRKLADLARDAEEQIVQNKDNADAVRTKLKADVAKENADFKEQQRQAKEGEIAGRYGVAKDLIGGRIESLKEEARYGNIAAASEAKRLEITAEFAEKRENLNKKIRDPNVSAAEKDLAQSQLSGLDAQEKRRKQVAFFTGGISAPDLVINQRGSGSSLRAREENSSAAQLARLFQSEYETSKQILTATNRLIEVITKSPELRRLFPNGR